MRRPIVFLLALAGLAACAPIEGASTGPQLGTPGGSARQCFQPDRIINFAKGVGEGVNVRVLGGGVFALQSGGCPELASASALTITPSTGIGGGQLCVGDGARIAIPNVRFGPNPCLARVERSLTAAEIEALPGSQRP